MSPPDDYVEESEEAVRIISEYSRIDARTLLNIGCGGGHNDCTLKRYFSITGVDLSVEMLSLAGRLNPEVEYIRGDMRTVRLGRRFDAVTIFDSISYMLSEEDLRAAFRTAYTHLNQGGVLLTYAEETAERFKSNRTRYFTGSTNRVEVTFIEHQYDPDPSDTISETAFVYFIHRDGHTEIETDRHLFGLFGFRTWLNVLSEVGFKVTVVEGETKTPWGEVIPWFVCSKD